MSKSWPAIQLREIMNLDLNRVEVNPTETYEMVGVYSYGRGLFRKEPVFGSNTSYKFFYRLNSDHVVMSQLFGWEGALALSSDAFAGLYVSPQFPTFLCDSRRLDQKFLGWCMRRPSFWQELGTRTKGMGDRRRTLNPEALLTSVIPFPSLPEQRRIVAQIDKLAAKIDEAKSLRRQAVEGRQAILPAILGQFFKSLAQQSETKCLGDLSSCITDGPHKTPHYVQKGVPFVTVKNMVTGKLDLGDVQYITPEDHLEFSKRSKPEKGDVLYSKDGATRGRPCFVDSDYEFNIFVSVALIKPLREKLDGQYLCHLLNSTWIKDRMVAKSRGDMIPHIVLREIRQFPIPVPPFDEQIRIVAYLDGVQAKVDALNHRQAETAIELDDMLPSILDRAFTGELH